MRNKYGNIRTEVDGITFASKAEAHYYQHLKILLHVGEISELVCQPRYELQAAFTHGGKKIPAVTYVGDFQFVEAGQIVCVDVKGRRTAVFELKRRLFLFRFPDIDFRVVE